MKMLAIFVNSLYGYLEDTFLKSLTDDFISPLGIG
jgi:hypothetical protein